MTNETYYSILGISETATPAEIKTAYLRLIRDVHPDRIANAPAYWQRQAEEKCKEINEAYAVLSSDKERRLYDAQLASGRTGQAAVRGTTAQPPDPPPPNSTQRHQAAQSAPPPQNANRTDATQAQDSRIGWQILLVAVAGVLGLVAIAVFTGNVNTSQPRPGNTAASPELEPQPINSWRYTKSIDEMTGQISSRTACIFSEKGPGELCSYTGSSSPAIFKVGETLILDSEDDPNGALASIAFVDQLTLNEEGIARDEEIKERSRCHIRMRADNKPVFEVCGAVDSSQHEVNLYDSKYGSHRPIPIMTVLKTAKIIRVELKLSTGTQIFTFRPDKPLEWPE